MDAILAAAGGVRRPGRPDTVAVANDECGIGGGGCGDLCGAEACQHTRERNRIGGGERNDAPR